MTQDPHTVLESLSHHPTPLPYPHTNALSETSLNQTLMKSLSFLTTQPKEQSKTSRKKKKSVRLPMNFRDFAVIFMNPQRLDKNFKMEVEKK
jgi:hypothetical protein